MLVGVPVVLDDQVVVRSASRPLLSPTPQHFEVEVGNPAALKAVRQILSRQSNVPEGEIQPTSHLLLDLGIDSIGRIDVLGSIEGRFNMKVDEAAAAKIARVADILRIVGSRTPTGVGAARGDAWRRFVGTNGVSGKGNGEPSAAALPIRWLARGSVGALPAADALAG